MSKKRQHSVHFKLQVATSALEGKESVELICKRFEVAESLVHKWKRQLLDSAELVYKKSSHQERNNEKETAKLYAKIGQLTMERDFLKKM